MLGLAVVLEVRRIRQQRRDQVASAGQTLTASED
jgi:hypothetical protein